MSEEPAPFSLRHLPSDVPDLCPSTAAPRQRLLDEERLRGSRGARSGQSTRLTKRPKWRKVELFQSVVVSAQPLLDVPHNESMLPENVVELSRCVISQKPTRMSRLGVLENAVEQVIAFQPAENRRDCPRRFP